MFYHFTPTYLSRKLWLHGGLSIGGNEGLHLGTWHYAQGSWLPCDAAATAAGDDGKLGGNDGATANEVS